MESDEDEAAEVPDFNKMPGYDGIIKSLFHREIRGKQLQLVNPFGSGGYPKRMKMSVEQVIPQSALEAGHVFMGFTNCNRYLLSYTVRPTDNFGIVLEEPAFLYHLHFWLFTPYKPAKKMATVVIFDNNGVTDNNLLIEMSQWRHDDERILVTGQCYRTWIGDHDPAHTQVYATIATVPKPCKDCNYFPDEDFEEENPNCTLNPCLKHGLTVNLNFDHVLPFPRFDADIQLRCKNGVVFNTGNVLHVFTFKTLDPVPFIPKAELPVVVSSQTLTSAALTPFLFCDFWLKKCSHSIGGILEKGPIREDTRYYANNAESDPDAMKNTVNTDAVAVTKANNSEELANLSKKVPDSPTKTRLMLPPQERKFFKQRKSKSDLGSPAKRSLPAITVSTSTANSSDEEGKLSPVKSENAYDISDIGSEEHLERFSSFRKRKLADKKYEFSDSDPASENITPLKLNRKEMKHESIATVTMNQLGSPRSSPRYERGGSESPRHAYCLDGYPRSPRGPLAPSPLMSPNSEQEVLRPINNTLNFSILKVSNNSAAGETDSMEKTADTDNINDAADSAKKPSTDAASLRKLKVEIGADVKPLVPAKDDRPTLSASINCTAKILRSYIHREDDDISVITDIEDDCNFANQFFAALPLDVHGEGYHQLHMISNAKAERSPVPVVQVLQRTLDIELLCNEVAGIICHSEDKTCFSCIDWDPAVIDVCPNRSTVTAVVFVLVEAVSKSPSPFQKPQTRYETMFTFAWDPDLDYCRIMGKGRLKEVRRTNDPWQPTKAVISKVKAFSDHLGLQKDFKVLVNDLMVSDFTTVTELEDARGMVGIYLENPPDKRRLSAFDDDSSTDDDDSLEDLTI